MDVENRFKLQMGIASALLLAILLLTSCGAGEPDDGSSVQETPDFAQLPPPSELTPGPARTASDYLTGYYSAGADYFSMLPHQRVSQDGPNAEFAPAFLPGNETAGALAFAIYSIDLLYYDGEFTGRLLWDGAPPASGNAWLALGERVADRWKWFTVDASETIALGDVSRYVNLETGEMFCAVVVLGGDTHQLKRLRFGEPVVDTGNGLSPLAGAVPFTLTVSDSGMQVHGTTVDSIDVDVLSDGEYEASGLNGSFTYPVNSTGSFPVTVRLNTDEGSFIREHSITGIVGNWESAALRDTIPFIEYYRTPQLCVVDGRPMLACIHTQTISDTEFVQELLLFHATSALAQTWGDPVVVPAPGAVAVLAMEEDKGCPLIAYSALNQFGNYLTYLQSAQTPELDSWDENPRAVGLKLEFPDSYAVSMAKVGEMPVVACIDAAEAITYFYRANGVWSQGERMFFGNPCRGVTVGEADGLPAMVIEYDATLKHSIYLRSSSPYGEYLSWTIHDDVTYAALASLGRTSFGPAYYHNDTRHDEAILRSTSVADGAEGWGDSLISDIETERRGLIVEPCMGADALVFLYNPDLFGIYAMRGAGESNATLDWSYVGIEIDEQAGANFDVCVCDGLPVVAYEEVTRGEIRVAVMR